MHWWKNTLSVHPSITANAKGNVHIYIYIDLSIRNWTVYRLLLMKLISERNRTISALFPTSLTAILITWSRIGCACKEEKNTYTFSLSLYSLWSRTSDRWTDDNGACALFSQQWLISSSSQSNRMGFHGYNPNSSWWLDPPPKTPCSTLTMSFDFANVQTIAQVHRVCLWAPFEISSFLLIIGTAANTFTSTNYWWLPSERTK